MMYHITVEGFDSGMNELLNGVHYNARTRRVENPVKWKNDKVCIDNLRMSTLAKMQFEKPIVIHYLIFAKNRMRDRMNIASAFDKSFEDALQKVGTLKNDGWNDVINTTYDFAIDSVHPRVEVIIEEVESEYVAFDWGCYK